LQGSSGRLRIAGRLEVTESHVETRPVPLQSQPELTTWKCHARVTSWQHTLSRLLIVAVEAVAVGVLVHLRYVVPGLLLLLVVPYQPKSRITVANDGLEIRWLFVRQLFNWEDVLNVDVVYETGINWVFGLKPRPTLCVRVRQGRVSAGGRAEILETIAGHIRRQLGANLTPG
jgi:hypothetical protein